MSTLGQKSGLSGYTCRSESEFDPFGAAHGCNSISAGLGRFLHFVPIKYVFSLVK